MKIRMAALNDLNLVSPLFDQYRQFYKQPSDPSGALNFLKRRMESRQSVIFIALAGQGEQEAAGFAQLYPSFSSVSMKPLWILNDLFVTPRFRKQQIAKALLQKSADYAVETAAKGLTLMTSVENKAAQQLYVSMGWRKVIEYETYNLLV
jgi:GNAT superfamily N-acetyltransferase